MMPFNVAVMSMSTRISLVLGVNVGVSFLRLATVAVALSSMLVRTLALPALPLSPNLSAVKVNTSSLLAPKTPHPPEEPVCPSTAQWGLTLGRPSYDDCDYILSNLYPKDPLAKPVLRNFYSAPVHISHTLSNFLLPYEQNYKTCNIQMLLATDFNNIPRDEATWNELRGATRTIFRSCILGRNSGGVVTKNGHNHNIEILVYGNKSVYAKNQILKHSSDPLARSIAAQELLELMNVVMTTEQTELEIGGLANNTASATAASALPAVGAPVATA